MSTGDRHNTGKPRLSFNSLGRKVQEGEAAVWEFGAKKYAPGNWLKGMSWAASADSFRRHLDAFLNGEDCDPETGLPHVDHLICCAKILSNSYHTRKDLDDRAQKPRVEVPPEPVPGTVLVLAGPQGCGATTLARHVAEEHGALCELDTGEYGTFIEIEAGKLENHFSLGRVLAEEPATVIIRGAPSSGRAWKRVWDLVTKDVVICRWAVHERKVVEPPNLIFCVTPTEAAQFRELLGDKARIVEMGDSKLTAFGSSCQSRGARGEQTAGTEPHAEKRQPL